MLVAPGPGWALSSYLIKVLTQTTPTNQPIHIQLRYEMVVGHKLTLAGSYISPPSPLYKLNLFIRNIINTLF